MKRYALLAIWLAASCGSSGERACEPETTDTCTCTQGGEGTRSCLADGSGWGTCECPCTPTCGARVCGPDPVCSESCGDCTSGTVCDDLGQCQEETCTPDCDGLDCGPDPVCGESCGDCEATYKCNDLGQCVEETCTPDCAGLDCGPDPVCGESCGDCAYGYLCNDAGACEEEPCEPDCAERVCGPEPVCGESCGDCDPGHVCNEVGQCVEETCTPDCTGLACGPDPVCGLDCGACDPGSTCSPEGQCEQEWLVVPGERIGPVHVSTSASDFTTLGEVRALLGENGAPVGSTTFTLAFVSDNLRVTGIDVNANQAFDDSDHIISLTALNALPAETAEGLTLGSTFSEVRSQPRFADPDQSAIFPPYGEYPGGKMDSHFGLGVYIGYDDIDTVSTFIVSRPYPQPPDGTIDPGAATLTFGADTIACGDGINAGTTQDVHRRVLGGPDWSQNFDMEIQTENGPLELTFYLDSYRILGMEFIGGDDTIFIYDFDKLVIVSLYPFFYGETAAGNGLGSTRTSWEAELGAPIEVLPGDTTTVYVYQPSAEHKFAVTYTNDGASMDDVAVFLILNYQTG